jgi:predicted esterase
MRTHHLLVHRSARFVTAGPTDGTAREVWVVLHGYGQLAGPFAGTFAPLDDGTRLIVAPEGLSRFYLEQARGRVGASWMTREDRDVEIEDYVRYLDAVTDAVTAGFPPKPIHVLGFSQGSATACRWIERGRVQPARLVVWGGEIPPDLDWSRAGPRLARVSVVLVAGTEDRYITAETLSQFGALLALNGVRHTVVRFPGGHEIDATTLRELARDGVRDVL